MQSKIRNKKWIVIVFLLLQSILYSQKAKISYDAFSISGTVKDSKSNTLISNADLQKPFNQKFFFRVQTIQDSVFTVNEEASINSYSPNETKDLRLIERIPYQFKSILEQV